jgi:hypothetical protein
MRSFDATQNIRLRYRSAVNEYWVEDITRLFTCVRGRSLRLQVITHATPKGSSSQHTGIAQNGQGERQPEEVFRVRMQKTLSRGAWSIICGRRFYTSRIQNRMQCGVAKLVSVLRENLIERKKGTRKYHKEQIETHKWQKWSKQGKQLMREIKNKRRRRFFPLFKMLWESGSRSLFSFLTMLLLYW